MAICPTFLLSTCCPSILVPMDRFLLCMLAVLCLANGTFAQSPLIQIPKGPNLIAAKRFNPESISPLCSHFCINVFAGDVYGVFNRPVHLDRCFFLVRMWNEWWAYDSSSKAITVTDKINNGTYCLDNLNITTPTTVDSFRVNNCTGEITQQWILEDGGKIRSALLSQSRKALYLLASLETDYPNVVKLFLGPAETEGVHLYFTFIPVPTNGSPLSEKMAAIPSPGAGSNLVSNGGFEHTSTGVKTYNNFALERGGPDICYWTVGDMNVDGEKVSIVGGGNIWWYSQDGSNSLLLGAPCLHGNATLTQLIRTRPRENYTLSFWLAGYSLSPCKNRYKTVRVELSPSNNSLGFLKKETYSFDSAAASPSIMGWELMSLNFSATTEVTNLTFINSMNEGNCAPVIDNVSVLKQVNQVSLQNNNQNYKRKSAWYKRSVATIIGIAVAALIVVSGLLVLAVWLSKRSKMPNEEWKPGDNSPDSLGDIRTFTMGELAKATNNFTDKVGEGGFGAVYRANLEGNRTGAVKRAKITGIRDQKVFEEELSVHLRIRHPYVVKLIGLCFERGEQILVFEFAPKGSLYDRLHKENGVANPLPWASRVHIAFQVAVALEYLHEEAKPPVVHRDIKSSNVLLIDDSHAKLADFGLSRLGPKNNECTFTAPKGSYGYMDPQYIITGKLSVKSDVYSFGVLLLEFITGLKSVQGTMTLAEWTESHRLSEDTTVMMEIVDSNVRANVDSKEVENIIKISNLCLADTGELRPSMSHIVTMMKNTELMPSVRGTESAGDERYASPGGGVLGSESLSFVHEGR